MNDDENAALAEARAAVTEARKRENPVFEDTEPERERHREFRERIAATDNPEMKGSLEAVYEAWRLEIQDRRKNKDRGHER